MAKKVQHRCSRKGAPRGTSEAAFYMHQNAKKSQVTRALYVKRSLVKRPACCKRENYSWSQMRVNAPLVDCDWPDQRECVQVTFGKN